MYKSDPGQIAQWLLLYFLDLLPFRHNREKVSVSCVLVFQQLVHSSESGSYTRTANYILTRRPQTADASWMWTGLKPRTSRDDWKGRTSLKVRHRWQNRTTAFISTGRDDGRWRVKLRIAHRNPERFIMHWTMYHYCRTCLCMMTEWIIRTLRPRCVN